MSVKTIMHSMTKNKVLPPSKSIVAYASVGAVIAVLTAVTDTMAFAGLILPYVGIGAGIVLSAKGIKKLMLQLSNGEVSITAAVRKVATAKVILPSIATLLAVVSIVALLSGLWSVTGIMTYTGKILSYVGIGAGVVLFARYLKKLMLRLSDSEVRKTSSIPEKFKINKLCTKADIQETIDILKAYKSSKLAVSEIH